MRLWNYNLHKDTYISGDITVDTAAVGFRLLTFDEWQYAAKGNDNYKNAGSHRLDEVGWYLKCDTHSVKNKKSNSFGLYDMSENDCEWEFFFE